MYERCVDINKCEFFRKNLNSEDIINQGIISVYCGGIKHNHCSRKAYFDRNGYFPNEDVSPISFKKVELSLVLVDE